MNAPVQPTATKAGKTGDYPDDVLSDARDILRTVQLALMSQWIGVDDNICLAATMDTALNQIERVRMVLEDGVRSQYDPATPKGKMVIPEFAPQAVA